VRVDFIRVDLMGLTLSFNSTSLAYVHKHNIHVNYHYVQGDPVTKVGTKGLRP